MLIMNNLRSTVAGAPPPETGGGVSEPGGRLSKFLVGSISLIVSLPNLILAPSSHLIVARGPPHTPIVASSPPHAPPPLFHPPLSVVSKIFVNLPLPSLENHSSNLTSRASSTLRVGLPSVSKL